MIRTLALAVAVIVVAAAAPSAADPADPRSLDSLAKLAMQPPAKATAASTIDAIRALGKVATDRPRAVATLARVIERELPPLGHDQDASERALHLAVMGAAVNALAEQADPRAVTVLLPAMYRAPELLGQFRRAIVASGRGAAVEVRKALRGEHPAVNAVFRSHKLDQSCDDGPCKPVSARAFYAAIVLGDLHDASATADLLAVLGRPPVPAYYFDGTPGPTQHTAVFDALRKLGSPDAAPKLRALWQDRRADAAVRAGAAAAYGFVARDTTGVDALGKIAADNTADDTLRQEAALAYARLARDRAASRPLLALAQQYVDAAAKKRTEATAKDKAKLAADADFDKAKQALETAKAKLLATARDANATAAQIRDATAAAKRVEDDFKTAKRVHRDKIAEWKALDSAARAYAGYARMFQTHAARIEIAARCGDDRDCYAKTLTMTPADAVTQIAGAIPGAASWSAEDKQALVEANVDRAMVELGKRGGAPVKPLADALRIDNRAIRQSVVLALPKLAPPPCDACALRLDEVSVSLAGKDQGDLQLEMQLARAYFRWPK